MELKHKLMMACEGYERKKIIKVLKELEIHYTREESLSSQPRT